jgi:hypothetical protein
MTLLTAVTLEQHGSDPYSAASVSSPLSPWVSVTMVAR